MTHRIREAHIERVVREINDALGVSQDMYVTNIDGTVERNDDGEMIANVGHVYVDHNAGGYRLERVTNGGGGSSDIMPIRSTKRNTYAIAMAYMSGLKTGREIQ